MRLLQKLLALAVGSVFLGNAHGEEIHAAVAANFTATMKEIVAQFEAKTHHKVIVSYGSSGKIFAQIKNGAPYQVFLSADQDKPKALEQDDYIVPGSRFTYAIGALALWSAKPDFVDENHTPLQTGNFNKLALANPKLAPYGAAAIEVLHALKLTQPTQSKWVRGENIAQTYQFVATGNADLGFVALSQIMAQGHIQKGSTWIIPDDLYSPIRQDAVLLKRAIDSAPAKSLVQYLQSEQARTIIHSYGYKTE
jgi:molybdate transport system substrate-binding protein